MRRSTSALKPVAAGVPVPASERALKVIEAAQARGSSQKELVGRGKVRQIAKDDARLGKLRYPFRHQRDAKSGAHEGEQRMQLAAFLGDTRGKARPRAGRLEQVKDAAVGPDPLEAFDVGFKQRAVVDSP